MDAARLWAFLHRFKADWRLMALLMVPNAVGIVYGYYYYWQVGQFDPSSAYFRHYAWWPLIADSPNAVLLMSASLVLYRFRGRRSKVLDTAAFLAMVYVGLWTTALFLLYPERMGTFDWSAWPQNANPLLFVSHLGMPLEALVLVHDMRDDVWPRWGPGAVLGAGALFLAVDYWGPHLHPAPFLHPLDGALHAVSPWLMALALAAWLWTGRMRRHRAPAPIPDRPLREED